MDCGERKTSEAFFLKFFTFFLTQVSTVDSELEAAASNYFDEIFAQDLLSKNCVLLRLLLKGGFYFRAYGILI